MEMLNPRWQQRQTTFYRARGPGSQEIAPAMGKHIPSRTLLSSNAKALWRKTTTHIPGTKGRSRRDAARCGKAQLPIDFTAGWVLGNQSPWGFRIFKTKPPTERKNLLE